MCRGGVRRNSLGVDNRRDLAFVLRLRCIWLLATHSKNQIAKRRNGAREIGGRGIAMQKRPVHHKCGRRKSADRQSVVGAGKLNLKRAVLTRNATCTAAGNVTGKTGLAHDLDTQVLQQVGNLGLMHAILKLTACITEAQVMGNLGSKIVDARSRLDIFRSHGWQALVHGNARRKLLGAHHDLLYIEQLRHMPLFLLVLGNLCFLILRSRLVRRRCCHANQRDALTAH